MGNHFGIGKPQKTENSRKAMLSSSVVLLSTGCILLQACHGLPLSESYGDELRSLDSLGNGNVLKSLDSLGNGNVLRQLDSLGNGNVLRGLDSLGNGNILRGVAPQQWRFNKRGYDPMSGMTFGMAKKNFDEIDRAGFERFVKKNFDEIDRAG